MGLNPRYVLDVNLRGQLVKEAREAYWLVRTLRRKLGSIPNESIFDESFGIFAHVIR